MRPGRGASRAHHKTHNRQNQQFFRQKGLPRRIMLDADLDAPTLGLVGVWQAPKIVEPPAVAVQPSGRRPES